jgi:DNA polymerase-3 subunit delta'
MNLSTIIVGQNDFQRNEKVRDIVGISNFKWEDNPDLILIDQPKNKKSIGIDEVRIIPNFLAIKPFSYSHKVVIIKNGNILTPEAQNSLLKILEETPKYGKIIIEVKHISNLLPTILSRCQIFILKENIEKIELERKFLDMSLSEKFSLAEMLSKKEKYEVMEFLNQILIEIKNSDLEIPKESIYFFIDTQEKIAKYNLNTRLALENLFLNFEITEKKV